MARTHQRIERWDLPADGDQWEAIRAADAYLRRRLGVGKKCHAGVFDARGQIYENDLHMAYEEWQQESSPLRGVVVSYGTRLRTYMRNCSAKTSTGQSNTCLLYTSDAADEEDSVDLGGRRIIKKKKENQHEN